MFCRFMPQSELVRFAAALVVARLAKAATPQQVMQFLVRVMLEAPSSLDLYLRLPCGRTYPWSATLWALSNLGPARLADLSPVIEERLSSYRDPFVLEQLIFVRLLLFIIFAEPPRHSHPARSAETLTTQQHHSLLILLKQGPLWHDGNFLGLLKAYGVPATRKGLAAYLGREAPTETPSPWARRREHPNKVYADRDLEVALEEELRQHREQEQRVSAPSLFPEIDRLFRERPKLEAGEDETPIGGYFY